MFSLLVAFTNEQKNKQIPAKILHDDAADVTVATDLVQISCRAIENVLQICVFFFFSLHLYNKLIKIGIQYRRHGRAENAFILFFAY